MRVVTREALQVQAFGFSTGETEAAGCHVVVVKSSMAFNKGKATVIIR